jgi:uncharacterized repeat protein (TIGR02543 family)|nr:MAG TPA: hypothetical protein [Caudoviricetes sp.]
MALPYVGVSASANNSTIYVTGHFYNNGSTWQGSPGCRFTLSIDGIGNIYDQRRTFNGNSFDFSASRGVGTSYNNRTYTVHAWWDSSGFSHGTDYATTTVTVPAVARPTYTVSYNANGGSGAPSNQTKQHDITLTLSSVKPTRSGYTFAGWGTSATDTGVKYSAGGQYTGNSNITLYAIWTNAAKMTLAYNANGGSGAPSSQTHLINTVSKISGVIPTRNNYVFLGWSTSSSATSATYIADGQYTNNNFTNGATVTLYAVWLKRSPSIYINSSEHSFKSVWVNVPSGKSLKSIWFKTG